jgi:hypothetical protein
MMAIKYMYFFSNNCYNDLVKLISDILSKPHKVPKDMYRSKYFLGNLVRMHYPGKVTQSDGTISPATSWDDYALSLDATYGSTKGAVWSDFWVSFSIILFQNFIPNAPGFATA